MSTTASVPLHRMIVVVDIENSTARTNSAKARMRGAMYTLLDEALHYAGITDLYRDRTLDRGDGAMVLIRPADQIPKTAVLAKVFPTLSGLLSMHNERFPSDRFRLRAVLHAGEVHYDNQGMFGTDLDLAVRLLDAASLKTTLRMTTAPLVLVVSDHIHRAAVAQGYNGIDARAFLPLVNIQLGNRAERGWVSLPSQPSTDRRTPGELRRYVPG